MSLSNDDLSRIRNIVEETIVPLQSEIMALKKDIKKTYTELLNAAKLAGTVSPR